MITIERIMPLLRQEHGLRVYLSDGTVIQTRDYVVAELGLHAGETLMPEQLKALKDAAGKASARERAVRIVSAAGVSKADLQQRLTRKGERPEDADAAVQWLSNLELLDDRKTAEQLVHSAVRKGYGKARIRQILYEKRIPREYWEQALEQVPDMDDAVDKFLNQRFRGREPDEKEVKRAAEALMRRGYSWQEAKCGLERYGASLGDQWEEPYE